MFCVGEHMSVYTCTHACGCDAEGHKQLELVLFGRPDLHSRPSRSMSRAGVGRC